MTQEHNQVDNKKELEEFQKAQDEQIRRLLGFADQVINRSYIPACPEVGTVRNYDEVSTTNESNFRIRLYKLNRFVFAPDESVMEKLKSVYLPFAFHGQYPTLFLVIHSNDEGIQVYLGIQSDWGNDDNLSSLGKNLKSTFEGVFAGSELSEKALSEKDTREIMPSQVNNDVWIRSQNIVSLTCVPSVKKDADQKAAKIGLEQFIDVMNGKKYTAILVAASIDREIQAERKRALENLGTRLSAYKKCTIAMGWNDSKTVGVSLSKSKGTSKNEGRSFTTTNSHTTTHGKTEGISQSNGGNDTFSGGGYSVGWNSSNGTSKSWSHSESFGLSEAHGVTSGTSTQETGTKAKSNSQTNGNSRTATIEIENKNINNMLQQVDSELKHLKDAQGYGLWECAAYFVSASAIDALMAANAYKALILGDASSDEGNYVCKWGDDAEWLPSKKEMFKYIFNAKHPLIMDKEPNTLLPEVTPTTAVSGMDLPYFLTLPLKSIPGLVVDTIAPFERTVMIKELNHDEKGRRIDLGQVSHMGKDEKNRVELNLESFTKHCFITGSTGSGKSNTMLKILENVVGYGNIGFLVIEPAKGEYKKDLHNVPGLKVYTTNPLCERLLRLNPFRFPETVHVLEHVDRLLGIFGSCWELTAAMPALLKKAVEEAYLDVGWDLTNSIYLQGGEKKYPTFATVVKELRRIIDQSDYSAENKGNYKGALVTRVESLASGILRRVFCSETDVSYQDLFDGRTIVDLSRLGSAETKTLIMGTLVMLLGEHRMDVATRNNTSNSELRHITILEEAHNLLRNTENISSSGGSTVIAKSVEMISNAIAEMRTYGEGFVIVDQSPGAVDISAIKNTNTKIVMRLPEQTDCEAMGKALSLEENQQKELSKLRKGHAIVMQDGWTGAVMVHVDKANSNWSGEPEYMTSDDYQLMRAKLALRAAKNVMNKIKKDIEKRVSDTLHFFDYTFETLSEEINSLGDGHIDDAKELITYYYEHEKLDGLYNERKIKMGFGRLIIALLGCEDCWRTYLMQTVEVTESDIDYFKYVYNEEDTKLQSEDQIGVLPLKEEHEIAALFGKIEKNKNGKKVVETAGKEAFKIILSWYLPDSVISHKYGEENINILAECVREYLSDVGIYDFGATVNELTHFNKRIESKYIKIIS